MTSHPMTMLPYCGIFLPSRKDLVDINHLLAAVQKIKKVPDMSQLQKVAEVLDLDGDGKIDIHEVKKVWLLWDGFKVTHS